MTRKASIDHSSREKQGMRDEGASQKPIAEAVPAKEEGDGSRGELLRLLRLSTPRTAHDYRKMAQLSAYVTDGEFASGYKWDQLDSAEIDALLAEYQSLRQESMNTINNRTQILLLGLAAVAALAGGSLTTNDLRSNLDLINLVFSGAIPLVCVFVFLVWLSEAVRCHRAGVHLAAVTEARINAKLGKLAMTWEASLWTGFFPRDEMFGPSMLALALIGLIAVISPLAGQMLAGVNIGVQGRPIYEIWGPWTVLGMTGIYGLRLMPRLKNIPTVLSPMHREEGKQSGIAG
jgi:hypothetical protein